MRPSLSFSSAPLSQNERGLPVWILSRTTIDRHGLYYLFFRQRRHYRIFGSALVGVAAMNISHEMYVKGQPRRDNYMTAVRKLVLPQKYVPRTQKQPHAISFWCPQSISCYNMCMCGKSSGQNQLFTHLVSNCYSI